MTLRKPLALPVLLALASLASAQSAVKDQPPVVMAPMSVAAGPLGYLGITFDVEVDVGFFSRVSDRTRIKTMIIQAVTQGSPAQYAGLIPGDLVLKIDGQPITDYTIGALKGIRDKEKGDKAEFVVSAPGTKAERTVDVIVGGRKLAPK